MFARGWFWVLALGMSIASAQTPREAWRVLFTTV